MSLYKDFKTNVEKEAEGVAVEFSPNTDKTIPTFRISRMGKSNKRYTKLFEIATRPHRRQIDLGTLSEKQAESIAMGVFVDAILLGWENVKDATDEPLEFSKENAIKLFTDLPELYDDLVSKASSAALFREASLEEEEKNS